LLEVAAKKCPIYPEKKMFESGRGESVQSGKGGEKGDPSGGDLFRRKTGPVLAPFAPLSFFRSADMKSGGEKGGCNWFAPARRASRSLLEALPSPCPVCLTDLPKCRLGGGAGEGQTAKTPPAPGDPPVPLPPPPPLKRDGW